MSQTMRSEGSLSLLSIHPELLVKVMEEDVKTGTRAVAGNHADCPREKLEGISDSMNGMNTDVPGCAP